MNSKTLLHFVTFTLVLVGALNWGLIALFGFNLVSTVFGSMPNVENIVYILVGVSAVVVLLTHKSDCKVCSKM